MTDKNRIIELAVQGGLGVNRGYAMGMKRRLEQPGAEQWGKTQARRKFLGELIGSERPPSSGGYTHPARVSARNIDRDKNRLDASDLAWLERLPRDPTEVSLEDAATVHGLLKNLRLGRASESDRRLVQSIWQPIKALHDKAEAVHNLELARRPLPELSEAAVAAVAEVMCNEDPSLDPEWATIQARRELDHAHSRQARQRDRAIEAAQRQLAQAGNDESADDELVDVS